MTTTNQYNPTDLDGTAARQSTPLRLLSRPGLLMAPALLFLLFFYVIPLTKVVYLSVGGFSFTSSYYADFFTSYVYVKVLIKTLYLSAFVAFICLLLGYPIAYAISNSSPTVRNIILLLVVVPYLTSFLVRSYALIIILSDRGLINSVLVELGIADQPIQLVYNTFGVYVGMVHIMLPFMILPLFGVMNNLDRRLVGASHSLGAGPVLGFLRIYLPLSFPGIFSGCLIVFVLSLGFFITPALLGGLGDVMLVNLISIQVSRLGNWEFASAASVILLVATLCVVMFFRLCSGSSAAQMFFPAGSSAQALGNVRNLMHFLPAKRLQMQTDRLRTLIFSTAHKYRMRRREHYLSLDRPARRYGDAINVCFVCLVLLFLIMPSLIVIPMSFSSAEFITFPPPGWSLKWYQAYFDRPDWLVATSNSFQVAILTTLIATVLGTLAAYGLIRGASRFKQAIVLFVISPIVVPPVVLGLGLYGFFVDTGLFGTKWGLALAHSIGATALVTITVAATLSRYDFTLVRAAMSLGAGPIATFRKITLPIIRPGIIAGGVFAFIHSFDELVMTMMISGIQLETLPLKMWRNIKNEIDPVIAAVSVLLIALPVIWVTILTLSQRGPSRREPRELSR